MKKFFGSTAGKVAIVTVVVLLIFGVFMLKMSQDEKAVNMEPEAAVAEWTSAGLPVFVDFTADWCPYCKEMEPIIEEIKQEYAGKMHFVTVNVDEQRKIAQAFGTGSVPSYAVLDAQGNLLDLHDGAATKDVITAFIEDTLGTGELA